jgi:hypothetical protein
MSFVEHDMDTAKTLGLTDKSIVASGKPITAMEKDDMHGPGQKARES